MHKLLVVDDEIHSIKLFERSFRKIYDITATTSPEEAIQIIKERGDQFSAILCDQRMPKVSGIEVLRLCKSILPDTIRIMVSCYLDANAIMECINECEAYCYVLKPYDVVELDQVLREALLHREREINNKLIISDFRDLLFGTIGAFCDALEEKDTYTIGHSRRVTAYALLIGAELGLSPEYQQKIKLAGLLHDIGKIGTPEKILNKPGKLSDEEFEIIRQHPVRGAEIIRNIKQLGDVVDWVKYHHERFDGRGYPNKLAGENIPFGAAILAVADTYDAMTSDRSYRKGLPHEVAIEEIIKCSGSQFNPDYAAAFIRKQEKAYEILNERKKGKRISVFELLA
ncbi:MAG: HD domain-containing phosphohydrolase [Cyanobacteriota bacterium]